MHISGDLFLVGLEFLGDLLKEFVEIFFTIKCIPDILDKSCYSNEVKHDKSLDKNNVHKGRDGELNVAESEREPSQGNTYCN